MESSEIIQFRREFHFTQEMLARRINLSQAQISKIERNEVPAPQILIDFIARTRQQESLGGSYPKIEKLNVAITKQLGIQIIVTGEISDMGTTQAFRRNANSFSASEINKDIIQNIVAQVAQVCINKGFRLGAKRVIDRYREFGEEIKEIAI